MYKTTKQFVDRYLSQFSEQEATTVVAILFVIESLLKSTPSVQSLLTILQDNDDDQALIKKLLVLLADHSKATQEEVKNVREYFESRMEAKENRFVVTAGSDATKVEAFLKTSFGAVELHKKESTKAGVSVTGEWYYFSRDIDHDLDNLLS